tara:strand:+ start:913 stop:1278 length:366 start_codon:yes stop_codon:yes gene_type:complete
MSALSIKLPITKSDINGYKMIVDFPRLIKQNFKMLCLTTPGERVMEPLFGAGLKRFLFLNENEALAAKIDSEVREQAAHYLPVIEIGAINTSIDADRNSLFIEIQYEIPHIGVRDLLEFTI